MVHLGVLCLHLLLDLMLQSCFVTLGVGCSTLDTPTERKVACHPFHSCNLVV
jgi:hypothetical protein